MESTMRIRKSITKDDLTKTIEVEQVENGYIITIEKYGRESKDSEYISECKRYISETNPLEDAKPQTGTSSMKEALLNFDLKSV